jgi:hypothetical protein
MIKNKENTDYTSSAVLVCNLIVEKYGYTARITRIWEMLRDSLSISEFEFLDFRNISPEFESYMVDRLIDWNTGKDVDFSQIKDAILTAGYFTGIEKLLLNQEDIEDRLWGIFLAVSNPGRTINLNNKKE